MMMILDQGLYLFFTIITVLTKVTTIVPVGVLLRLYSYFKLIREFIEAMEIVLISLCTPTLKIHVFTL